LRAYLTQGLAAVSRGPGRLERAIRALCDANPDAVFATEELAAHCYPAAPEIERKHLVAVRRAMRHVLHWESEPTGWGNFGALYARHIYANIDSPRGLGRAFAMRELDEIERSQSVASRVAMLTEQQLPDGDQSVAIPAATLTALAARARTLMGATPAPSALACANWPKRWKPRASHDRRRTPCAACASCEPDRVRTCRLPVATDEGREVAILTPLGSCG
jgi:hypothetical protein